MTDEKFLFVTDCADKKRTARGIHNKRTYTGKGGKVRFPSDYKSRKELDAMNGEVVSYKLNQPMTWEEFKALPDDIKKNYIKLLREKYDVPDSRIAEMLDCDRSNFYKKLALLGINTGENRGKTRRWDVDGWEKFLGNDPAAPAEIPEEIPVETEQEKEAPVAETEATAPKQEVLRWKVPESGNLVFTGDLVETLKTVAYLLAGIKANVEIKWTRIKEK